MTTTDPLALPRILCLHGGGVNAEVFRLQCRVFLTANQLAAHFRLVFADGPFPCLPHAAIVRVYGDYGPFYRWLRWKDEHAALSAADTCTAVLDNIRAAMDADEGTGAWVGLMGFSQGAKLAASILWRQENVSGPLPRLSPEVQFRFAVLMAGGAPPVMLDPTGALPVPPGIETADNLSLAFDDWPATNEGEHVIGIPTLHVHGLKDPGIERHRKLLDLYCERGTARVVEWDGDHRIPFKTADVSMVVKEILQMAKEAGVL